jgi:tRNA threonylcarbamoyladenosine biosynthesis protein TsaE
MTDVFSRRCPTERDTIALGTRIGEHLEKGALLSLHGPLGAGKTVLVRGIAAGLGADPGRVRSPTFVLHHIYRGGRMFLHHLDLYRLGSGADVSFLDIEGLLETGAVVVEWGELGDLSRFAPVDVSVDVDAGNARVISRQPVGSSAIAGAWAAVPAQA